MTGLWSILASAQRQTKLESRAACGTSPAPLHLSLAFMQEGDFMEESMTFAWWKSSVKIQSRAPGHRSLTTSCTSARADLPGAKALAMVLMVEDPGLQQS